MFQYSNIQLLKNPPHMNTLNFQQTIVYIVKNHKYYLSLLLSQKFTFLPTILSSDIYPWHLSVMHAQLGDVYEIWMMIMIKIDSLSLSLSWMLECLNSFSIFNFCFTQTVEITDLAFNEFLFR